MNFRTTVPASISTTSRRRPTRFAAMVCGAIALLAACTTDPSSTITTSTQPDSVTVSDAGSAASDADVTTSDTSSDTGTVATAPSESESASTDEPDLTDEQPVEADTATGGEVADVVVDTSWLPCDETTFAGLDPAATQEQFAISSEVVAAWSGPQPLAIAGYDSRICGFFSRVGDDLSSLPKDEVKIIVDVGTASAGIEDTKELVEWSYDGNATVSDITVAGRPAVLYTNANVDWDATAGIVFELPEGNVHVKTEFDEEVRDVATNEAALVALAEQVASLAP